MILVNREKLQKDIEKLLEDNDQLIDEQMAAWILQTIEEQDEIILIINEIDTAPSAEEYDEYYSKHRD